MKREYLIDEAGNKTQCWIDGKIIWIKEPEFIRVFYYDSGVCTETSKLYPEKRIIITSSRSPKSEWKTWQREETQEQIDSWVGKYGSFTQWTERDAFCIPSVFFTSCGPDKEGWETMEKAIEEVEAGKHPKSDKCQLIKLRGKNVRII